MPDVSGRPARDVIDTIKIVQEVRNTRVFPVVFQSAYVEFSEVHWHRHIPNVSLFAQELTNQVALVGNLIGVCAQ